MQVRKSIEHVIALWKRDPSGDRVSRPEPQAAPPQPTAHASRFSDQPPAGLPGPPGGGPNATHIKVVSYMPAQQRPQAQQASWQQQQQLPLPPQQQMRQPGLEAWMQQQAQVQQQYNQQQMQQQQAPQMAPWEQQALQQQPQQQVWAPAPANGYPPNPPQPLPPPPQQPVPVCLAVTTVLHPQLKDCTCLMMLLLTALVRAALRYSRMTPPLKSLTVGARML